MRTAIAPPVDELIMRLISSHRLTLRVHRSVRHTDCQSHRNMSRLANSIIIHLDMQVTLLIPKLALAIVALVPNDNFCYWYMAVMLQLQRLILFCHYASSSFKNIREPLVDYRQRWDMCGEGTVTPAPLCKALPWASGVYADRKRDPVSPNAQKCEIC